MADEELVVRARCLAWALVADELGVWGGTTREERSAMGDVRARLVLGGGVGS